MDSRKFKKRIQHRLYHACASDCDSDSDVDGLSTSSLPLTETCMEYFQDSFPGSEGLGRLDMPMAATITKRNQVSPCSVVLSMMYAKRLRQRSKQYLHSMSSTDVFFISMMMASKYLYDEGVDEEVYNDEWAASVGHETDDVNQMEMDFLNEMDWHLFANHDDFDNALTAVERRLALKEGVKRGWFTYTEMAVLLEWDLVWNLWNQVGVDCTKMVSLLSAVYVTSVVSMMGSAAIALQLSGPMASATIAAAVSLHTSISTARSALLPVSVAVNHNQYNCSFMEIMDVGSENLKDDVALVEASSGVSLPDEVERFVVGSGKEDDSLVHVDGGDDVGSENSTDCVVEKSVEEDCSEGRFEAGATLSKLKLKQATSVFSMWLFDSLISQVWSVFDSSTPSSADRTSTNPYHHGNNLQQSGQRNPLDGCEKEELVSDKLCENCGESEGRRRRSNEGNGSRKERRSNRHSPTFRHGYNIDSDSPDMGRLDTCAQGCASGLINLMNNFGALKDCVTGATTTTTTTTTTATTRHCKGCEEKECLLKTVTDTNSFLCCFSSCLDCDHQRCANLAYQDAPDKSRSGLAADNLSTHHDLPPNLSNKDNSIDLILPLSLMTEVPILDPIGFFTKNSSPANYVLST